MINVNDGQTIATFGTGDIGIYSLKGEDGKQISLGLSNQSEREVGSLGDFKVGVPVPCDKFDILFDFNKVESVDALINALQEVKEMF